MASGICLVSALGSLHMFMSSIWPLQVTLEPSITLSTPPTYRKQVPDKLWLPLGMSSFVLIWGYGVYGIRQSVGLCSRGPTRNQAVKIIYVHIYYIYISYMYIFVLDLSFSLSLSLMITTSLTIRYVDPLGK